MAVASPSGSARAPRSPATSRARGGVAGRLLRRFLTLREGSIIVVTVITIAYFAASTDHFLTYSNWLNLLPYFCFLAIMAAGQVFVMTLGEIDLSIGASYLFTPFVFWEFSKAGLPLIPSLILSLVVAGGVGVINGVFIAYVRIPSFVVTLAMLFFLDGLTLILSHSEQTQMPGTKIIGITTFARIFGGGTYSEFIWAIGIVVILQVIFSATRWGIYTVASGGNKLGASEAGINVRLVLIRNFILCAMTAGFAGILEGVRTTSLTPDPSGSQEFLLYAIAAVIIGGTLMTGGEGTVVGALVGALFIGVLQEGLAIKSVPATYVYLWLGIAVLIAMVINVLVRQVRVSSGHG